VEADAGGAGGAGAAGAGETGATVAAAVAAGSSYACLGVTLRYCLRSGNPVSTSMVVVGLTGVVFLGGLAYARLGPAMFTDTTLRDFLLMSGSGWFNALAFLALTSALTRLHVGQVNMLNSTRTAMAAIVGVAAFNEPLTALLVAGIGLTIIGLFIKEPPTNGDARDQAVPAGEEML